MSYNEQAKAVRRHVLGMVHRSGASHVGTSLSCADIMVSIYAIAKIDPKNPSNPSRDRVILSKGHGVATWYAVLAEKGFFPKELLQTYYSDGSPLTGHPDIQAVPGIETTTGSLGHGLPVGIGMALAAKIDKAAYTTYVIIGDGECNEGTIWESALSAAQLKLDNLVVIIDRNKHQGLGYTEDIMKLEPLDKKWESFGWHVRKVDGHNHEQLIAALRHREQGKPLVLIADTTKGKGVSYMEDQVLWHYRNPDSEQYAKALEELDQ